MDAQDIVLRTMFGACQIKNGLKHKRAIVISPLILFILFFAAISITLGNQPIANRIGNTYLLLSALASSTLVLLVSYGWASYFFMTASLERPISGSNVEKLQEISWKYLDISVFVLYFSIRPKTRTLVKTRDPD
jgi:hypothetical protein